MHAERSQAEGHANEVLELCERATPSLGDLRWNVLRNKGLIQLRRGDLEVAERDLREAVAGLRARDSRTSLMLARHGLGLVLLSSERPTEAERIAPEAVELARGTFPLEHPNLVCFEQHHADCLAVLDAPDGF